MTTRDMARRYIAEVWGHDGGAVRETADLGHVSDVDRAEIDRGYTLDGRLSAGDVADAIVILCREIRPCAPAGREPVHVPTDTL